MKHIIRTISTLITLTTLLAHGAAETGPGTIACPNQIVREFIGFKCRKEGGTILQTPSTVEPGKSFPITVVHSDLPELQNLEVLGRIATKLATLHADESHLSEEACNALLFEVATEHGITVPYKVSPDGYKMYDSERMPLCVLWINLSQTEIRSCGTRRAFIRESSSENKLFGGVHTNVASFLKDFKKDGLGSNGPGISFTNYFKFPPLPIKENVQTCAEALQQEMGAAFCLTIGIKKWLELQSNLHASTDEIE